MQLFPAVLFGVSASLDALIVGISYGIRRIRIGLWQNLLISIITLSGTCLSVRSGSLLVPFLPSRIGPAAGGIVLIVLGVYYIIKCMMLCLKKYRSSTTFCATEIRQTISLPEALSLGLALSVNNMGIGLSASIAGLSLLPAAVITFICSILFLLLGNRLGKCSVLKFAENSADLLSGILLIILGVLGVCR